MDEDYDIVALHDAAAAAEAGRFVTTDPKSSALRVAPGSTVHALRTKDGATVGVGVATIARPPRFAGTPVYRYALALGPSVRSAAAARRAVARAFRDLAERAPRDAAHPAGVFFPIDPEVLVADDRACVWDEAPFVYAGKDPDGRPLRIAWFEGARIARGIA